MDSTRKLGTDTWTRPSSSANDNLWTKIPSEDLSRQNWELLEQQFQAQNSNSHPKTPIQQDWDPTLMLNNLSFLEQKIHQLQELVHLVDDGRRSQSRVFPDEILTQQQQLVTADLTSIIVQLISTAGTLLPSSNPKPNPSPNRNPNPNPNPNLTKLEEENTMVEEHESRDEEEETLIPGSYEILQLEKEEILAPHTHFCTICGKGFKRDANLRMHMRGHGDEYKTPEALAKPHNNNKGSSSDQTAPIKRYSCPFMGCKRNKDHHKFQPLKTILCVKNHYKRTHCDKSYVCSRCHTKKFSVLADLKTHEKHCGRDKWLCSCGTTFSRKDKLFGHIALFQGHTPAISMEETKGSAGGSGIQYNMDAKTGINTDPTSYFSPLNFDNCDLISGFQEFSRPQFEDSSESSFAFLLSGSYNYPQKPDQASGSNDL